MNSRRFLPSPSMGVALLALAIALGGTAYAANKIGTDQLENNAVTSKKIKKAVNQYKLAPKSVKKGKIAGDAVNQWKLADAAVTASAIAEDAVDASKISDYGTIGNGTTIEATNGPTLDAARDAAPATTLYQKGPFTIYAKCFRDTVADQLNGEMYLATTEDFSIMEGNDDLSGGPAATDYLNSDTPEVDRQLDTQTATGTATSYNEAEGMAAAPGGPAISMVTGIGVKNGPVLANGPYGPGNACVFQGGAFG